MCHVSIVSFVLSIFKLKHFNYKKNLNMHYIKSYTMLTIAKPITAVNIIDNGKTNRAYTIYCSEEPQFISEKMRYMIYGQDQYNNYLCYI